MLRILLSQYTGRIPVPNGKIGLGAFAVILRRITISR